MTLNTGTIIHNRYRTVKLLGEGGFGAVYKAWDTSLNRPCALKMNLDISSEAQRQFEREAMTLSQLLHPNLPRVTDYFFVPGQGQFLVMDFVEGEDLESIIARKGAVPEKEALKWINQVADALTYLHNQPQPIIHRDIKPANIRITPQGQAYLVDFGLVKVYDKHLKTTMGARAVTPGYSPPEQYGQGDTNARTDIYALSATLYTLLTGREPQESVMRIVNDEVAPAWMVRPGVNSSTSAVIAKGMALRPTERYQSAEDLIQDLKSVGTILKVTMPSPDKYASTSSGHSTIGAGPQTGSKNTSRSKLLSWPLVLGLLVVITIFGLLIMSSQQGPEEVVRVVEVEVTRLATVTATSSPRPTSTPRPTFTRSLADEMAALSARMEADKEFVFGAESGILEHNEDDLVEVETAGVSLKNFVASVRFINPYGWETGDWDYGFLFREVSGNNQLRLSLYTRQGSDYWDLTNRIDEDSESIAGGVLDLNDGEGESNLIKLIADDERGLLYVNDVFISELDLSSRTSPGDVSVATGIWNGDEIEGESTEYKDFAVWSLHSPFGEISTESQGQVTPSPSALDAISITDPPPTILMTDNCDPRTSSNFCQSGGLDIFDMFYGIVDSLKGSLDYAIPRKVGDLLPYDLVIANMCGSEMAEMGDSLKEYIELGGSVIITGDDWCHPSEDSSATHANILARDYGIEFQYERINDTTSAFPIVSHPLTSNVASIYTFTPYGPVYLEVSDPATPLFEFEGQPFAAIYEGEGTLIAIGFSEFHWGPTSDNDSLAMIASSYNDVFWENMLVWMTKKSRLNRELLRRE